MRIEDAYKHVESASKSDFGRFFSPGTGVNIGKGVIHADAVYPVFELGSNQYITVSGVVYILTHECDIDTENQRDFNEDVLIAPIINLESLVEAYLESSTAEQLTSFLTNLGSRNISRLVYVPPITERMPYGGVIFFNQIANCHISTFEKTTLIAAVTGFGLNEIDYMLENHLLRTKADRLAFVPEDIVVPTQ